MMILVTEPVHNSQFGHSQKWLFYTSLTVVECESRFAVIIVILVFFCSRFTKLISVSSHAFHSERERLMTKG